MEITSKIVSSLEKVFCRSAFEGERLSEISALKGERVSFQIAVKCSECAAFEVRLADEERFPGRISIREVQLVPSLMPSMPDDEYVLASEPGLFPDVLVPFKSFGITERNWHAVWVTAEIPADAAAGTYQLKFILKFTSRYAHSVWCTEPVIEKEESVSFEIADACLPEQKLKVTHWFHADCLQHHHHVSAWSEEHWTLLEKYFRNFIEHKSNLLLTPLWSLPLDIIPGETSRPVCQLLKIALNDGKWSFNFDRLKRWIETAQKAGIKNFEMVHAFSQWGLKYAPEIMVEIDGREVPYFGTATPSDAPEYACFLRSLMKELLPFLRSLGLNEENCYFHVSDEPRECDLENYRYASNLFKEILEGFPVIDALSSIKFFKEGLIGRPVPNITELDEFMQEEVTERWVYYAGAWQDGAPGRQLGMPSLRNRVLGILLYVYGCEGFLEWGYNFWFSQFNRTWDVNMWQDTNCGRCFRSGGAHLVYPGPDGPVDSLRHEVIAEGFQDEMALRLLESKTSREEVLKFLDEETGFRISVRNYPRSEKWLLDLRMKINRKLAQLQ